jgi:hypothetical protein
MLLGADSLERPHLTHKKYIMCITACKYPVSWAYITIISLCPAFTVFSPSLPNKYTCSGWLGVLNLMAEL